MAVPFQNTPCALCAVIANPGSTGTCFLLITQHLIIGEEEGEERSAEHRHMRTT